MDVVDFRCDFNIILIFSKSFHSTFVITNVNTRTTEGYILRENKAQTLTRSPKEQYIWAQNLIKTKIYCALFDECWDEQVKESGNLSPHELVFTGHSVRKRKSWTIQDAQQGEGIIYTTFKSASLIHRPKIVGRPFLEFSQATLPNIVQMLHLA